MADFRSNRNVLFSCKYHVVFCPKYRKPVPNPPIDAKLKKLIQQVCDETQSALIEMEVMPDQQRHQRQSELRWNADHPDHSGMNGGARRANGARRSLLPIVLDRRQALTSCRWNNT
jgi:hypothetical protein